MWQYEGVVGLSVWLIIGRDLSLSTDWVFVQARLTLDTIQFVAHIKPCTMTMHNAHYTMHNAHCTLHTPTHTSDRVNCSAGQSVIKSKELNPVVALQWPPSQPSLHIDNRLLTLTWSGLVRTDGSCYFLHVWCRPEPGWLVSTFQVKAVDN